MTKYLFLLLLVVGCSHQEEQNGSAKKSAKQNSTDSIQTVVSPESKIQDLKINDTLNTIASLISGSCNSSSLFAPVINDKNYKAFSTIISKRWESFDTSRIVKLRHFEEDKLSKITQPEKTLFYPFSGPDILHANLFFPDAERYILVALEPVGTLPEFKKTELDSLQSYYNKINTSLNAILKFSFFRTLSMSSDLKNEEVDGSIHLLFLFLNRLGHSIVSAKPITLDTLGSIEYLSSFQKLKTDKFKTEGVEIVFKTKENKIKSLEYYSLNAVDFAVKKNKGFALYLNKLDSFNTYLKGASYLLHKDYFSIVRNKILEGSSTIVQDDSGIALNYFEKDTVKWKYDLFGEYTKPVSLFSKQYQKNLDSLYKKQGSTPLGFGLGYNFKDKNSNLMVINRP